MYLEDIASLGCPRGINSINRRKLWVPIFWHDALCVLYIIRWLMVWREQTEFETADKKNWHSMLIHKATLAFALAALLIAGQPAFGGMVLEGIHFQGTDVVSQSPTARGPRKSTTLPGHKRTMLISLIIFHIIFSQTFYFFSLLFLDFHHYRSIYVLSTEVSRDSERSGAGVKEEKGFIDARGFLPPILPPCRHMACWKTRMVVSDGHSLHLVML